MNAPSDARSTRTGNRLLLLLIGGIFVLPIVIAWLLTSGRIAWRPATLINHGVIIAPPLDLATLPKAEASAPLRALAPADWALLYVSDRACDDACRVALRELAAMRLVIGKEGTRLSVFGLFSADQGETGVRQLVEPALVRAIADRLASNEHRLALPFIGFLDWRGQLMMHFSPAAPPDDIKRDLKRLLNASAIK